MENTNTTTTAPAAPAREPRKFAPRTGGGRPGGRRFSFSVVLAIGDKKGSMGLGIGKAGDTTLAIQKAFNDAKKNMIKLRLNKRGTIPHDVKAKYKSARVMLMPNTGRGVVVGSAMRVMVELAGITDITGRVISGTKDKLNIAQATMKALSIFKYANKQS